VKNWEKQLWLWFVWPIMWLTLFILLGLYAVYLLVKGTK